MRLSKLKLAGFKSFVDPTTVQFPSNLIGVVGPNGCGKSNIIDAVRWVMGEISAKHLRGNDMTDVIFNGATGRKPVGNASVEMVFDNSDGTLAGPYAAYAEVSLKRQVSRDGQSTYFINGSKCRRKDITQLFLGTGLGTRSYAIIEQGMISRLIEAKPDDLRAFLEEAAGISKYKERRRETENRISHTRENLDRLNDLREELDKQIRHLQRQAATAKRYQTLKEEERKLHAELLALKLGELERESAQRGTLAREREIALEAAIAGLRAAESAIEKGRERHTRETEALNAVQARYYQAGAETARCEQAIQHARELRARQRTDLADADGGYAQASSLYARDEADRAAHAEQLAELEPALAVAQSHETAARDQLSVAEQAMQVWQQRWEVFTKGANESGQKAMVERARIEQLDGRLRRSLIQQERLEKESAELKSLDASSDIAVLIASEQAAATEGEQARGSLSVLLANLQQARERERALQGELDRARAELSRARGSQVSLEALQQAALGQVKGKVVDWLEGHALAKRPRLAQQLKVAKGWSRAVETVLGSYLEAVCVDGLDAVAALVGDLTVGQVTFVGAEAGVSTDRPATELIAKVSGPAAIESWLRGVYAVDNLQEALVRRATLASGESVITRDGVWLGHDWLRVSRDQDAHAGVIEREVELTAARDQVIAAQAMLVTLEQALSEAREQVGEFERTRESTQENVNRLHSKHVELKGQLAAAQSRSAQSGERLTRLTAELVEVDLEIKTADGETRIARQELEAALELMQTHESRRPEFELERERLRDALQRARTDAQSAQRALQEVAIGCEARRSSLASLATGLARLKAQLDQFSARRADLELQLQAGEEPLAQQQRELDALLSKRLDSEHELAGARASVESAEADFRALDEARITAEGVVESARQATNAAALAAQETRVRRESLQEQFAATRFEFDAVVGALAEGATAQVWETHLAEVTGKIERLGPVNLAAIDEFKEQTERKEYLDRQFNDLNEALNTLEQAIRKIDRETRERFQDTFDKVNQGLQAKFPKLFGGGSAYLELTGDDVLAAGVTVMARPPGKRNSTISQLSGGEKALTAVALVFSIFELNPAPFCLLDEVDAPLDDHNVGRFCDIVREMSEQVQFVFITHNKNTMELARQLVGVTMNEPGVSRLVSVDVDEALRMAAAG